MTQLDEGAVWRALLALREIRAEADGAESFSLVSVGGDSLRWEWNASPANTLIEVAEGGDWRARIAVSDPAAQCLDLYLPMALSCAARPLAVGHLGQSLDGRIATESGRSHYVTGEANLIHLHRMRALCDAVIVGAATVEADDPQLTVRRVPGPNPLRVVIDPRRRLASHHRVFDEAPAPTLRLHAAVQDPCGDTDSATGIAEENGSLPPAAIVAALHARGLFALFVEGGGVTVSRFLQEGALDRLQVAVAPLIIGSGRAGLTLPRIDDLAEALRPDCRTFAMGADVLFDCALEAMK